MRLTRIIEPTELPVSLEEVKLHCRVDHNDEDTLLTSLIAAATDYLDGPSGILGRAIINQEWLIELDEWPIYLVLPIEPIQTVLVKYNNEAGIETTIAGSDIILINNPSARSILEWVDGFSFPKLNASRYPIGITLSAGFGAAAEIPESIKVAIQMIVGNWYENREATVVGMSVVDLPMAVNALLARWRVLL
ncbi:MAG TPA: hypothetical protein ENH56_05725 [Roseobacter sp.]|uniref:Phage gp6-like head-tail connector protein n=1 Tax=marine sediment metagenome TaxID=412755 RepID=A0A0F9V847_9ZZZZ|nr:hypothetical protein [Roseobacter sp.]